jgi:hypothetical protein
MPQADLTSFHALIVSTFCLVVLFFCLTFYYMTPLWSLVNKLNSKKVLTQFFLTKQKELILNSRSHPLAGKASITL